MADETYQSLYRRYRPQRFDEVRGQNHVTQALRNAVRDSRVSHGYLFSGPRGTGKTSSARILAKALNCTNLEDGEPCGRCASCVAVQQGASFDVHELDAASNRGVDAMRDLVSRAALGTPGRWKVYIVDEVHHLTTDAATTLLKTLEEPPAHVVFVLATTEPHKVLPTIRSRVQHYEFHLLPADDLVGLVADVNRDAGLGLADDDLERVVRRGAGSARDALSALDQAAALGHAEAEEPVADEIIEAIADGDVSRAVAAVAQGAAAGRDSRRLAEEILSRLREVLLMHKAPQLVTLVGAERARVEEQAVRLRLPTVVRAMELIGEAMGDMRDAVDPRVSLDVAVVRAVSPEAGADLASLAERVDRLERLGRQPAADAAPVSEPAPGPTGARAPAPAQARPGPPPAAAKPSPAKPSRPAPPQRRAPSGRPPSQPASPPPGSEPSEPAPQHAQPAAESGGAAPSRDELTKAWGDSILASLKPRAKALFGAARFVEVSGTTAVVALPNAAHCQQCEPARPQVEQKIAEHFGVPMDLRLVAEESVASEPADETEESEEDQPSSEDLETLEDAPAAVTSPVDLVKNAFGAEEVDG